jgi:hypothetical protein
LETATKEAGWDVAVGEGTYGLVDSRELRGLFESRKLTLKGYAEPVAAFGTSFATLLPVLKELRRNVVKTTT